MSEKKELSLDLNAILNNKCLIADFIIIPEKRKQLMESDDNSIRRFFAYFIDKNNAKQITDLISTGQYKKYYDANIGHTKPYSDLLIDLAKEIIDTIDVFKIGKIIGVVGKGATQIKSMSMANKIVKGFISDLSSQNISNRIEGYLNVRNGNGTEETK
ncbi:hypothetical protein PCCS19_05840 [Paenibacillus sp. CCS19]|uniref:hypothetical protein n=1 Tax=Paenibacillus sp. CCS19 TaxID=3158387 RepID=UPI00256154AB|nr:hypothetical protein [Paenibacillus cellulosilyticus]GMK37530.1 hypothetical protein PCCS19_05840 [Paenibacillus cellulosilyticus]